MKVLTKEPNLVPDPVPLWFLRGFVGARAEAPRVPAAVWDTPISEVMRPEVVSAAEGLPVDGLRRLLLERGAGSAVVMDRHGRPAGVASRTDVLRALDDEDGAARPAGDIMTPFLLSLPPDASVSRAAALMAYEGVHQVIVITGGEPVGAVSALDLARWLAAEAGFPTG